MEQASGCVGEVEESAVGAVVDFLEPLMVAVCDCMCLDCMCLLMLNSLLKGLSQM